MRETTSDDLQLSVDNMQTYIGGPVTLKTTLRMLQDEMETGSKTKYPDAMEARVHFLQDNIRKFGDIIVQCQAWHQYVTK